MLYFFHSKQDHANDAYFKGLLFEELLKRYLVAAGYRVTLTRAKHASLEYDIEGEHEIDQRPVVGEAKAHVDSATGQQVAAFVGKATPFLFRKPPYSAVFLSTSPLTPEANDYLDEVRRTTPHQIVALAGEPLESDIRSRLALPSRDTTSAAAKRWIPKESCQHVLHTDLGTFLVVTGAGDSGSFDDRFVVLDASGLVVTSPDLIDGIREHVSALQNLAPAAPSRAADPPVLEPRRIPEGLLTAASWIDYRRPADEQFFVGRVDHLDHSESVVLEAQTGVVLEIKSRSGVGKSSLLAVLRDRWVRQGYRVDLHDARDVQSSTDVLRLLGRLAGLSDVPALEHVPALLTHVSTLAGSGKAVFMVDQLESTFHAPEVFAAYEYVALCVARAPANVAMVYSRKDDLLTTHDQIVVNLGRLRDLSHAVALEDFTREEASSLLRKTAESMPSRVAPRILSQVLEFAQGFPWLLKRTMAHVGNMVANGARQDELVSSGLHLEDLFEEEVAELDEHERGYLSSVAAFLPATFQTLARRFENDPLLPGMLEKLTSRRLLRFSAGTYDTYNDVFKEYLLYERMPERAHAHVYRLGPVAVMEAFRQLGGRTTFTPDELAGLLGRQLGSTYNLLREMRLAGLVARTQRGWGVPEVVRQFEHQGRLGEYVRRSVLRNKVVADLVLAIERSGPMDRDDLVPWLREKLPFVDARSDVWATYANRLVDWCARLLLVRFDSQDRLIAPQVALDQVPTLLGNLEITGKGARPGDAPFVPSSPWTVTVGVLRAAAAGTLRQSELTRSQRAALTELKKLAAIELAPDGAVSKVEDPAAFEERIRALLQREPYSGYWALLAAGVPWGDAIARAFGFDTLAPSTRTWLGKRLANWGRRLGYLSPERLQFRRQAEDEDSQELGL